MTGLWQVSGRNRLTFRQGLELDVEYVRRCGFALDLVILLKTIPVVLFPAVHYDEYGLPGTRQRAEPSQAA